MIKHVFDPANETSSISVKADPGRIYIGQTNFFDLRNVNAIELSPMQASFLMLALQTAIAAEAAYSEAFAKSMNEGDDANDFL